jgi:hypothetical protein
VAAGVLLQVAVGIIPSTAHALELVDLPMTLWGLIVVTSLFAWLLAELASRTLFRKPSADKCSREG